MIGSFGGIVFVVRENTVRTIDDLQRSTTARWATHDVLRAKPKAVFIGPGQDTISFTMRFDVQYGVRPRRELNRLLTYCQSGRVEKLIIGGAPEGSGKWYIESVNSTWTYMDNRGRLLVAEATVTLKEFL
ncbi:phage tail protein [Paenibacillus sp. GCM10012307]|uniref:Phage tail protein n=1 Tax=Paenibacillus roseus TaxID=2798579 RepID=A0A934J7D4_9BACL|nr:phage tail protein [Paenibacillus roseus]MBJ6362091.1 phage tail protein [Paenibacillus roseus]